MSNQLVNVLFPELSNDKWAVVDLNAVALACGKQNSDEHHWIESLHDSLGVAHSYGGWMEHRDYLLKNRYNKDIGEDHFWHLGIDYNVPVCCNVHLPTDAELVHSEMDADQNGGWGGKLIFKFDKGYFIIGHLNHVVTQLRKYKQGEIIGEIADRNVNGNWFPHLHLQCMTKLDLNIDGYSHYYDGIEKDFPNPEDLIQ